MAATACKYHFACSVDNVSLRDTQQLSRLPTVQQLQPVYSPSSSLSHTMFQEYFDGRSGAGAGRRTRAAAPAPSLSDSLAGLTLSTGEPACTGRRGVPAAGALAVRNAGALGVQAAAPANASALVQHAPPAQACIGLNVPDDVKLRAAQVRGCCQQHTWHMHVSNWHMVSPKNIHDDNSALLERPGLDDIPLTQWL